MGFLKLVQWTRSDAKKWYRSTSWIVGFNYIPSYASNSTDTWQPEDFSLETISAELFLARSIGLNTCRVFLQYILWRDRHDDFITSFERFIEECRSIGLRAIPVLFDDCAFGEPPMTEPSLGVQRDPIPGMMMPSWTPSPGHAITRNCEIEPTLQDYVVEMVSRYTAHHSVLMWDLYNEPGFGGLGNASLPLLRHAFEWARSAHPTQPVTVSEWQGVTKEIAETIRGYSDLTCFHAYMPADELRLKIQELETLGRPIVCTEWMARTSGSNVQDDLPVFRQEDVGNLMFGLVNGRSQGQFPWTNRPGDPPPERWTFHIFRSDRTPYDSAEVEFICDFLMRNDSTQKEGGITLPTQDTAEETIIEPTVVAIEIDANAIVGPINPYIYGHQIEFMGSCIDGGLWAELLFNRKFDVDDDNGDGVSDGWTALGATDGVSFALDSEHQFNGRFSQRVTIDREDAKPHGLRHPNLLCQYGRKYSGYIHMRAEGFRGSVRVCMADGPTTLYDFVTFDNVGDEWQKYSFELTPCVFDPAGELLILIEGSGTIWFDAASLMVADNVHGMVGDVIDLLRETGVPLMRFPGGCYADGYHFEQAIGDRDHRTMTFDPHWRKWDSNDFGTDEFLQFCRLLGAEPYITANFGSGSPEEAARWVEYCNGGSSTVMGGLRAKHGYPEPSDVRLWSIGNELWGEFEIGHLPPGEYANHLKSYREAMSAVTPHVRLSAVGAAHVPWNEHVVKGASQHFEWLSIHNYMPGYAMRLPESNPDEFLFRAITGYPTLLEQMLKGIRTDVDGWSPDRRVEIVLDEWNVMLPNALFGDFCVGDDERGFWFHRFSNHLQNEEFSLRDGLFACGVFHVLYRLCNEVPAASVFTSVNQVGLIRTNGQNAYGTPTFYAFKLYGNHSGDDVVKVTSDAPQYEFYLQAPEPGSVTSGIGGAVQADLLDVVATKTRDGGKLFIHAINRSTSNHLRGDITLRDFAPSPTGIAHTLQGPSGEAKNDYSHPQVASLQESELQVAGAHLSYVFPPHSATTIELGRST